jgi:serine/threonine protein kinase
MITEKFGRYTVLETLGAGSMGTVYKAEDPENGTLVAVKHVRSQVLYDQGRRERFLGDMLEVSLVNDPRISPILEIGDDDDDFYIVTPFLQGQTVETLMGKRVLSLAEAVRIASEAAQALQVLHERGIAHRGVKPSNIWVDDCGRVILSDCKISRFTELERAPRHAAVCARAEFADTLIPLSALSYMSPEQVRGEVIDVRTDVFSLGVLSFELISGRHPFEARNSLTKMSAILDAEPPPLTARGESVPEELENVIHKAMAKSREHRHECAAQLAADLGRVAGSHLQSLPSAQGAPGRPWYRRRASLRVVVVLGGLAALAAILFAVLGH